MSKHKRNTNYEEENGQPTNQPVNNFNLGNLVGIINSIDINSLVDAVNSAGEAIDNTEMDDAAVENSNAEIIRALRTLINADKVVLLQTIIQIYALSRARKR